MLDKSKMPLKVLVSSIDANYKPVDVSTRTAIRATIADMRQHFPTMPLPSTDEVAWRKVNTHIRTKLQRCWKQTRFAHYAPEETEAVPLFVTNAYNTAATEDLSPTRRRGLKLLSTTVLPELFDHLNLSKHCINGTIFPHHDPTITRIQAIPPFTYFWQHCILTKETTAGVTAAFLLWKASISHLLSKAWQQDTITALETGKIDAHENVLAALNDLYTLTETDEIERKLIAMGRFLYTDSVPEEILEQELQRHWQKQLEKIFWEVMYSDGTSEVKTNINNAQMLANPGSLTISEAELLALTIDLDRLPWKRIKRVLKLKMDPRQFVANVLSTNQGIKNISTSKSALQDAIEVADQKGYLEPTPTITTTKNSLNPFSRPIHRIQSRYQKSAY